MNSKKKLYLMVLASLGVAGLLLILNIFFLFRLGSMQKQIDDLKETRVLKMQNQQASAQSGSNGKTGEAKAPGSEATEAPEAEPTETPKAEPTPIPENSDVKYVYLTFDDGPSKNTERILAILDQYKVKATFFVNGREDVKSMERYKKIAEAGHEIAMHSYSHDYGEIYGSTEAFLADMKKIQNLIEKVTGKKPMVYRFPGGSSNSLSGRTIPMQSFADVLAAEGIVYFDWNVDTTDGEGANRPVETLVAGAQRYLGNKAQSVILMHDAEDHDTTVEALPQIIQLCIDRGMTFDVITENTPPVQHALAK